METPRKAVRVTDVEAVPWQGTELAWRPLRHALGTRIAGMAAYTAEREGQTVVEGHIEATDGHGHEEVYVVLAGRATFTLAGATVDARGHVHRSRPAGAPARDRRRREHDRAGPRRAGGEHDRAALGGPPTFQPSASEWIERARPYIRTDPQRAQQIVDELRQTEPDSPGVPIAEALRTLGRNDLDRARHARAAHTTRAGAQAAARDRPDLGPLIQAAAPDRDR